MKTFLAPAALVLLLLSLSIPAFSQQGVYATVSGTVNDGSGALIPGVTIKATAIDTGVISTTVTNEAGAYNFGNLASGPLHAQCIASRFPDQEPHRHSTEPERQVTDTTSSWRLRASTLRLKSAFRPA
jgi:hypothetical protein